MNEQVSDNMLSFRSEEYVCTCEVLPQITVNLTKWPSRWARFWHWAFFGWKWRPM